MLLIVISEKVKDSQISKILIDQDCGFDIRIQNTKIKENLLNLILIGLHDLVKPFYNQSNERYKNRLVNAFSIFS